jgi:hypothetical protein
MHLGLSSCTSPCSTHVYTPASIELQSSQLFHAYNNCTGLITGCERLVSLKVYQLFY